ncbi:MAG: hypothetical protein WCS83_05980, partial [Endomicrobiia bacterium]
MDIVEFFKLPPIVFVFVSLLILVIFLLLRKLSYKSSNNPKGKFKSYACGEEPIEERRKPNY